MQNAEQIVVKIGNQEEDPLDPGWIVFSLGDKMHLTEEVKARVPRWGIRAVVQRSAPRRGSGSWPLRRPGVCRARCGAWGFAEHASGGGRGALKGGC